MSGWNGFGSLDLSAVEASTPRLQPGKYVLKVTSAAVESFGEHEVNKRLVVEFADVKGTGVTMSKYNLYFPASAQAQEIGRSQLKSLLMEAGHPTPDNPGDVESLKGLQVGVIINPGKSYVNSQGNTVTPNEIKVYFKPDDFEKVTFTPAAAPQRGQARVNAALHGGAGTSTSAGGGMQLDDEIPF